MNQEFNNKPLIAVGVLVINKNKALIIKRGEEPNKFLWSIPGGLVEIGEELEEAAIREVKEEIGIDVKIEQMIGLFNCINKCTLESGCDYLKCQNICEGCMDHDSCPWIKEVEVKLSKLKQKLDLGKQHDYSKFQKRDSE